MKKSIIDTWNYLRSKDSISFNSQGCILLGFIFHNQGLISSNLNPCGFCPVVKECNAFPFEYSSIHLQERLLSLYPSLLLEEKE